MRASYCAALLALASTACSWSRFDDVSNNAPVVVLHKPGSMKDGFGQSVTTARNKDQVEVLVGGPLGLSGAAVFQLGLSDQPSTESNDSAYCTGGEPCFLASSLAGFGTATGPDRVRPLCFAVGAGTVGTEGIIVRCSDGSEYPLAMPQDAKEVFDFARQQNQFEDFPLAADGTDNPSVLAATPTGKAAWFYPVGSLKFSELAIPKVLKDDSIGTKLAVVPVGDGRVYAVAAPDAGHVLLWKSDGSATSSYIGCLGGPPHLGRALASGKVTRGDDDADLVVSDDVNVHVLDGRALYNLPATTSTDCSFGALPAGALVNSFGCGSNRSATDCANSGFGAALAVGDLDGDGDGEVIVGAPNMTVREEKRAGAVLVYDVENSADTAFADIRFLSDASEGDVLGTSLTAPHLGTRDVIVAGAPGATKVAIFYCSALLGAGKAGGRCP